MKIRYYVTRRGGRWGYWAPCLARPNPKTGKCEPTLMARLGFKLVDCGRDGPQAWAIAESWNRKWDAAYAAWKTGEAAGEIGEPERVWPLNSLGEGFGRFRGTKTWLEGKKARTREDWERGWKLIEPVFGDVDPRTVSLEQLDDWYAALLETVGVREAHRAVKIWRALWRVVATISAPHGAKYCVRDEDPSLGIRRKTPAPRNLIWREGEVVRLVKGAIRRKMHGLAALLAVAWDTMFAPVDVRTLTMAQLKGDAEGSLFDVARAKTGKPVLGTLGLRARRVLDAYLATLPPNLLPSAPIFYTRGGAAGPKGGRPRLPVPYTADTLGDDFRELREALFPGDPRTLGNDFRRGGAVEALAGEVDAGALSAKMGNTIEESRALQQTYLPHQAAVVRLADAARVKGRARLRGGKETK